MSYPSAFSGENKARRRTLNIFTGEASIFARYLPIATHRPPLDEQIVRLAMAKH
jgi:hypothetical protein